MRKPIISLLGTALLAIAATAANAQSAVHLYIYDIHTGTVTQATGPMERDPYNASFSNNGKQLVHDLTDAVTGAAQLLGVTNLATGATTSLGVTGDNADWSPNGKTIAYTDYQDDWATDPSWSNNSRRLAFWAWDGEIGTVGLDGTVTRFDSAALGTREGYGCNPAYSPDGKLIVYQRHECFEGLPAPLMLIPVNQKGEALGAPYPITSGAYYAEHPSFSNNGKTIVFAGNARLCSRATRAIRRTSSGVCTQCRCTVAIRCCCSTGLARVNGTRPTPRTGATSCSRARSKR